MAGIHAVKQGPDHRHSNRQVLAQPWGVLHAHGVMVRQGATEIDEALLDDAPHYVVLFERTGLIGRPEGKREIEARPGMIRVREMAHDVSLHADLLESLAGSADHTGGETFELRPWSGRL